MEKTGTKTFTQRLFDQAQPIWTKSHNHPFVQGIGKGTLERDKFIYYMKQDYAYLIDYSKLFAVGVQKAHNLDTMNRFSKVLHDTLHFEMDLHREFAAKFGITNEELEATEPTPVNYAYTRYMLTVAQNGTLADVVAAILPCAWDYWEIGKLLNKQYGDQLDSNPYAQWIKTYNSDEFAAGAKYLIQLLDDLTEGKPERELAEIEKHFLMTSKYEYLFWDMNYHKQGWPI